MKFRTNLRIWPVLLVSAFCFAQVPAATNAIPHYSLVRLDEFLDQDGSPDLLLNNRGQVTAMVHDEDGTPHLFVRERKKTIELPLPADTGPYLTLAGRSAYVSILFKSQTDYSSYRYHQGKSLNLTNILPYKYFNVVTLNYRGRIVGGAQAQDGPPITAFSYYHGRHRELGVLLPGTSSIAFAVNHRGRAVGAAQYKTNFDESLNYAYHAVIFKRNGVEDLGTLDGDQFSIATGINDRGTVIGYSTVGVGNEGGTNYYRRGFVYHNGVMLPLPPLPGDFGTLANSINKRDQIVGHSDDEDGRTTAVIFLNGETFKLSDLIPPDSDVNLVNALSINDRGVIAAIGNFGESFLLVPE